MKWLAHSPFRNLLLVIASMLVIGAAAVVA